MPDHDMDHCGNHFRDHQCDCDGHQYHHRLLGICFLQPRLHNALCLLHHGRLLIQVFVQYSMKLIASKWRTLGLNLSINPEKIVFFFFRKQLLEKAQEIFKSHARDFFLVLAFMKCLTICASLVNIYVHEYKSGCYRSEIALNGYQFSYALASLKRTGSSN